MYTLIFIYLPKCMRLRPLWCGIRTGGYFENPLTIKGSILYATGSNGWNILKNDEHVGNTKSSPRKSIPRIVRNMPTKTNTKLYIVRRQKKIYIYKCKDQVITYLTVYLINKITSGYHFHTLDKTINSGCR